MTYLNSHAADPFRKELSRQLENTLRRGHGSGSWVAWAWALRLPVGRG